MSRVVNPDGVGKQRDRLLKLVAFALRDLAACQKLDDTARDLTAFLSLALRQVHETIDVTCRAWEKRDYWLKADQFRREWAWAERAAARLERVVLEDQWVDLPGLMAELAPHLDRVKLPKKNTLGDAWLGAYAQLREMRGLEQARVVR